MNATAAAASWMQERRRPHDASQRDATDASGALGGLSPASRLCIKVS